MMLYHVVKGLMLNYKGLSFWNASELEQIGFYCLNKPDTRRSMFYLRCLYKVVSQAKFRLNYPSSVKLPKLKLGHRELQ